MAIDWSRHMSPQLHACVQATAREMARLHALPDRWLGQELLKLARTLRRQYPRQLSDPHGTTYDTNLVWQLVPEVAKRMGAGRLLPNEASSRSVVTTSDADLRVHVGVYLRNCALDRWPLPDRDRAVPSAGEILCHSVANGNPIAMALDRLHAAPEPGLDRDDYIARHVREISAARGFEPTPYWTPELQDYGIDTPLETGTMLHPLQQANVISFGRPGMG